MGDAYNLIEFYEKLTLPVTVSTGISSAVM